MISIGKVANANYYVAELSRDDAFNYYETIERHGVWHGRLADDLGLAGVVSPDDFRAVIDGQNPVTGDALRSNAVTIKAFDVTVSVPKSVSVLWALADPDTQEQIHAAIDGAQAAVIEFLETEATKVRRGHAGVEVLDADGLLVAAFDHRTSRAGDPNLHRHLIVANASRGPDGRVTALDGRQIYRNRYTAEAVMQSVLRHELGERIGVGFGEIDRHGVGEIDAIPDEVLREFSQRRRSIEAAMAERGVTTGHGARIAALNTRTAKKQDYPEQVLLSEWRQRAQACGFTINHLPTPVRAGRPHDSAVVAEVLTEQHATFGRLDVIRAVARSRPDGATLDQLTTLADAFIASEAIELADDIYTTPEMLAIETEAARQAVTGQNSGIGVTCPEAVTAALADRPHLSGEQIDLVTQTVTSGDAVTAIIGKAGSGKTTALDALRDAYEHDGYTVIGACLAAKAAQELQSGAGIPSTTIHRTIAQLDDGRTNLDANTVLVIDEAAMVGTRQLAHLINHAHHTRTKVVLVGDPKQLPEIEAGGTFTAIARRTQPIRLTTNRRQQNPHERQALDALRNHDIDTALRQLHRGGRITTGDNADTIRTALVQDWNHARTQGKHAIMIAARRSDVADLNHRARQHLTDDGTIGQTLWQNDTTDFAHHDRVVANKNNHQLGLLNGNHATVKAAISTGLIIETDSGKRITVPDDYINNGHLTHAYALTVHKAQGMTCDRAYLLGNDNLYNELGYTGLSRAREHNHLYTVTSRNEHNQPHHDPLTDIRRGLGTRRAKTAAIDTHHGISR